MSAIPIAFTWVRICTVFYILIQNQGDVDPIFLINRVVYKPNHYQFLSLKKLFYRTYSKTNSIQRRKQKDTLDCMACVS